MRSGAVLFGVLTFIATIGPLGSARADGVRPALVWYRSADGCPDGAAFLARLAARGVRARLAEVGDPIDFVVTMGNGPEGARGLLERQTETRTVAIRRLDGGTCEQVADAIALSLVVANTPRAEWESESEPEAPAKDASKPEPAPASVALPPSARDAAPSVRRAAAPAFSVGFQGGGLFGAAPSSLLFASVFLELELEAGPLRGATLRVAALEAQGTSSSPRNFGVFLAGGRLEACPLRIGSEAVHASPCAAFTLGSIRTAGEGPQGLADHGLWTAVDLGARFAWRVATPIAIEAQAGALIPLERYDFVSDAIGTAYRTNPVGASILAGTSVRLP